MLIKLSIKFCDNDGTEREVIDHDTYLGPLPELNKMQSISMFSSMSNAAIKEIRKEVLNNTTLNDAKVFLFPVFSDESWQEKYWNTFDADVKKDFNPGEVIRQKESGEANQNVIHQFLGALRGLLRPFLK